MKNQMFPAYVGSGVESLCHELYVLGTHVSGWCNP